MKKIAKLIVTDSYFNIFDLLVKSLEGKPFGLNGKNLVFCEEKVSLMAERRICAAYGGTFNTDVFSFGNYLNRKLPNRRTLSKEGSAMAVKKILISSELKCFSASRAGLAPSLFELIIQLKSAKITPKDVFRAASETEGVLKNKLTDVAAVYSGYEDFLKENGFDDQSSALSYLPDLIADDPELGDADVFLIGFTGWTSQARSVVKAILRKAKSVTAILTGGENGNLFVNETAAAFENACAETGVKLEKNFAKSEYSAEGEILKDNLFSPALFGIKKTETDKVRLYAAKNAYDEIYAVAETIKSAVMKGARYSSHTVAVPEVSAYADRIKKIFTLLDIPYFLDEKKKPLSHPLVKLILSYMDVFRYGKERSKICSFFKNPLISDDKRFTDKFENYLVKYNVNYGRIHDEFTFSEKGEDVERYEAFRKEICSYLGRFDVLKMLRETDAENKLKKLSEKLVSAGEVDETAVNDQIYAAVTGVLSELYAIFGGDDISVAELEKVFLSGVQALELSIIPQYKDAVFVGSYRETALVKAESLFAVGLTEDVPSVKEDVALLSDVDINKLSEIKIMVEPKIKVVNHRMRENAGLGISAFGEGLYLSYPMNGEDGKKTTKSDVISSASSLFTLNGFNPADGYLTEKQGLNTFSKACGEYADGALKDFSKATAYYFSQKEKGKVEKIAESANREIKIKLGKNRSVINSVTSPTAIEDFSLCPYHAFAVHVLKLKDREEGKVNAISVGNVMHEILSGYVKKMDRVNSKEDSDELFFEVAGEILSRQEFSRYFTEGETSSAMKRVLKEAENFCYNTYLQFKRSEFKPAMFEVPFGKGDIPAIELGGGKVKLVGKIDRVDTYKNYYRVVDYKTGTVKADDKAFFAGVKLQLYLYAAAIKDKNLAGVFYLPVNEKYVKPEDKDSAAAIGKFLDDEEVLFAQDSDLKEKGKSSLLPVVADKDKFKKAAPKSVMDAYVDYALKVSEKAAEQMLDGVIVPSPYSDACDFCPYKGLCGGEAEPREIGTVTEEVISESVKKEAE